MEHVFGNFEALGSDWRAWLLAALVALKAIHAIRAYKQCPVLLGTLKAEPEQVERARNFRFVPSPRFLLVMSGGMVLAILGLYGITYTNLGPIALGALVIGIFMFTTEPNRLAVHNAVMDVLAHYYGTEERQAMARESLRSAHLTRAKIEIAIAVGLVILLLMS